MTSKSLLGEITSMIPLAIFNSSSIEAWPVHINVLAGVSRTNTSSELSEAVTSSTCSALKERKKKNQPQHFHEFFERIFSSSIKISNYNMKILSKCNAEKETLCFWWKPLYCNALLEFQCLWNITKVPCTGTPITIHTTDTKQSCSIGIISIMVGYIFESTGLSTWEKKSYKAMFCLLLSCMQLKSKTLPDKKLTNLKD